MSILPEFFLDRVRDTIITRHFDALRRLAPHSADLVRAQVEDFRTELRSLAGDGADVRLIEREGSYADPASCGRRFALATGPGFEFCLDLDGPAPARVVTR